MTQTATATMNADRPTKTAIAKGMRGRCPSCGEGALFTKYLKVTDECASCGQELFHHRADDGPAYLTILVVAHILGIAIHFVFVYLRPEPWVMATGFTIGAVALCLFLLPRFKGMIVAIQWANRMHGFGDGKPDA